MNRKLSLLVTVLLLCAVGFTSCGDDDDPAAVPEQSQLIKFYPGTTVGSSAHFQGLNMPGVTDTVYVTAAALNSANFDIVYSSSYWGKATFTNVPARKEGTQWLFEEAEGTILMPNRNPSGGGEVTYKEYPATLTDAAVTAPGFDDATFTVNANLGERAGIYTMAFTTSSQED